MNPVVDGIAIVHTFNQVGSGIFGLQQVFREDLLFKTKPCKVYPDENG